MNREDKSMLQYIKRMETEKTDLKGKINRAVKALENASDIHLDKTQGVLLEQQVGYMKEYLLILESRIAYEKKVHRIS